MSKAKTKKEILAPGYNTKDVTEQDAADIVEFTREFFHHVYVMPAKLKARQEEAQPTEEPQSEEAK